MRVPGSFWPLFDVKIGRPEFDSEQVRFFDFSMHRKRIRRGTPWFEYLDSGIRGAKCGVRAQWGQTPPSALDQVRRVRGLVETSLAGIIDIQSWVLMDRTKMPKSTF